MDKKYSIIAGVVFSLMIIVGVTVSVDAQTVGYRYNLKVGESETNYGSTKAGGSKFENKFYVSHEFTAGPSNKGLEFVYHPRYNGAKVGKNLSLKSQEIEAKGNKEYLSGQAVAGRKYKLRCKAKCSSAQGVNTTVTGRWTP